MNQSTFLILLTSCMALYGPFALYGEEHKEESTSTSSSEFLIKRIGRMGGLSKKELGEEEPIAQEDPKVQGKEEETQKISSLIPSSRPPPQVIEEPKQEPDFLSYTEDMEEVQEEEPSISYSSLPVQEPEKSPPTPVEPWGLFITGDFLWWSAHEEGLAFGSTGFNSNPTPALSQKSVPLGKVYNFPGKWGPGFRLGIGYAFQPKGWDLYLNWTRFYQKESHGVSSNPNNILSRGSPLYDEWGEPGVILGSPFSSINASWHLHYNTLDLELGRKFMPHKSFSVRPFIGIRGALILQRLDILEQENNTLVIPIDPIVSIRNQNNYRGIGLRAGVHVGFDFCHDWEFFGNFAAALLSGKFSVLNTQETTEVRIPFPYTNMHDTFWSIKPELEAALGLRWGRDVCNGRCRIELHAAWEELWWPDQNQMRRYLTPSITNSSGDIVNMPLSITEKGDLGLHGMTFGARLDF